MVVSILALAASGVLAPFDPDLVRALSWRHIGPYRGGRTVGAAGIPEQPNTFFIGVNNGGVWKTTDAGRTWVPIFDDQPTGSIGTIAVAPSNPNILYVGSGEGLQRPDLSVGDGVYRSDDGGKTWRHLGLRDGQQIGSIAIHPKDPDRALVAVLGHPYGPNEERGVFRTLDGGKSWQKVLYKDPDTCAIQVNLDPKNPNVAYADLWEARQGPWENGQWQGPGSGLYKSTDFGTTWKRLAKGLPTVEQGLGRIGFCIAPSRPSRLYATVDAPNLGGIYRSDDAGESWSPINSEPRLWGRGSDFAEIKADPIDPDTVYVGNTSFYRSRNGGKTWRCIKGSPGGDDYHGTWINPLNPDIILLAADQGATITVNGGETWSSWYNQPTAQLYHVATDSGFPYHVYGGQQESGSVEISSRGNDGQITFREWHPAGGDEYAYLAPDPLNPRYVFGGRINRYDKVTGQIKNIRPKTPFRVLRTAPVLFSKADPRALYFAGNLLFRTRDGGDTWQTLSPDLTRERPDVPPNVGKYRTPGLQTMAHRGVIYTVAPSPIKADTIWCGTDDGLIHVTEDDGKSWRDVTPPDLTAWSKVSLMDAGHFDAKSAYAAVNRFRLDDLRPHVYRTHDGGQTWNEIVAGLPNDPINVVREDPLRPGLLFCGSERAVYFSIDDGDHWHPLRLNMPATSIRDLVLHENDVVVATHGRGFWILDDYSLLREATQVGNAPYLFSPTVATILERNTNSDTPLPPEEPAGQNPPDGAPIDYALPTDASSVTIEIRDADGQTLVRSSSDDPVLTLDPNLLTVMPEWVRPPKRVERAKGAHRWVWDLRGPKPESPGNGLPISAIWRDTPLGNQGPRVAPGEYRVRLTVDGTVLEKTLTLRSDPRI
ncbi:MAG: hypothetical protein KIS66_07115 [Fimbriimonadaceae bacterium]|nr:hypothetical protein [Fimbriimonadaceae bacterium]